MAIMFAIVRQVWPASLLVFDLKTGTDVVVHTRDAARFDRGDKIKIIFNGVMANSLPPQITALRIRRISRCGRCR